jgi:hypothetical protein
MIYLRSYSLAVFQLHSCIESSKKFLISDTAFFRKKQISIFFVFFFIISVKNLYLGLGGVAQVVECLPGKCEALSFKPSTAKQKLKLI